MTKLTLETGEDNWTALLPFALFHVKNTLGTFKLTPYEILYGGASPAHLSKESVRSFKIQHWSFIVYMHESPRSGQKHCLGAAQGGLRTRRFDGTSPVPGGRYSSRQMTSSWQSRTSLERPLHRATDHPHCCQSRRHLCLDSCLSHKANSCRINPLG